MITVLAALGIATAMNSGRAKGPNIIGKIPLAVKVNPAKLRTSQSAWAMAAKELASDWNRYEKKKIDLRGSVMRNGREDGKRIAITIDDGPHPGLTEPLLKILKDEKVPATFFVVGFMAEKNPALVKAIHDGGFEVANHTYSHAKLTNMTQQQVMTEYLATNNVLREITGKTPKYCRPPGGDYDDHVLGDAARLDMTTVLWTLDPADYDNPNPKLLLERELKGLESGTILLLHDGSKSTLATLPEFIRTAKKRGYKFVTLDELREKD